MLGRVHCCLFRSPLSLTRFVVLRYCAGAPRVPAIAGGLGALLLLAAAAVVLTLRRRNHHTATLHVGALTVGHSENKGHVSGNPVFLSGGAFTTSPGDPLYETVGYGDDVDSSSTTTTAQPQQQGANPALPPQRRLRESQGRRVHAQEMHAWDAGVYDLKPTSPHASDTSSRKALGLHVMPGGDGEVEYDVACNTAAFERMDTREFHAGTAHALGSHRCQSTAVQGAPLFDNASAGVTSHLLDAAQNGCTANDDDDEAVA